MPKLPLAKLAQYAVRNPFTTAAAVFAPIFAKNEDRGYFRTALITTPVVFATGAFVPKMFGSVRDIGKGVIDTATLQKAEKWTRYETPNINNLQTIFQDTSASGNQIERQLSAYLVSERRSRDFMKEQKTVDRYFKRRFVKTSELIGRAQGGDLDSLARIGEIDTLHATKGRLVTNALHVARRTSLTPLEWANESAGTLSDLSNDEMLSMFENYKGRPEFVKTLKNRLREIKRLDYRGTLRTAESNVLAKITSDIPVLDAEDFSVFGKMAGAPSMFENLKNAQKAGFISDVTLTSEKVVSGEIGRILNVKVSRKGNLKPLTIPMVDPKTGQVRLSDNAVGVGNYVIGPDAQAYRIDEWISKQLAENPAFTNEQLEEEIAAHAYWMAGDPMDARRVSELAAMGDQGAGLLSPQAIKLRSYGAGITKLPLFNIDGANTSYYDFEFGAPKKVDFIKKVLNSNRFTAMGSEAGVYEGRFQLREAANLSPFGAPSAEKQDPIWRSVTKDFQLTGGGPNTRPTWKSTAWETLTGSSELPGAKFTVAGISPQDRTLFSELPKTIDELGNQRNQIVQKFLERGMSPEQAVGMYNDVYGMYARGEQGAFAYLGGMGETGFVMGPEFADQFKVAHTSKYNLDEIGVRAGEPVSSSTVMGFSGGERVLPKANGVVTDIAEADGEFVANVRHDYSMQGAKLDIAGIKGMNRVTETNDHFETLRNTMNNFYERLGSGDVIPSTVNVLAPAEYFTNKVEPAHAYLGIASDLVNRLEAKGASSVSSDFLAQMAAEGIDFSAGQFVINASSNPARKEEAAARLVRLTQINEEFFAKAGRAVRSAGGYQDPVLTAFVKSGKEMGNFMLKNQLPAMGFSWDHSLSNIPRFASISHDVESYMALGGHMAGLKAMRSRLKTVSGGDPLQSRDFLSHVLGGDFSKPFGTAIALKDAFTSRGSLTNAAGRAGSIFDPSDARFKGNFSIHMPNGQFLPVPGTEAYGAEASMFGPGKYQTREWQNILQDMAFEKNPAAQAEMQERLMGSYKRGFGIGKTSAMRPHQYDPMGVPGFLSTVAEQGDPFAAKVSRDWAERVHSKRVRDALLNGEEVVGMIQRQPTNEMMYMKYSVDPALNGTYDVGVPESVSRALMGDQDKDLVNSILFDANLRTENGKLIVASAASQAEREAAEEGLAAMAGSQGKQLEIWQSIKGADEIAARASVDWKLKSLASRSEKFATGVVNRTGVAVNRSAGAAIGAYSNVLTEMVEHMVRNPKLMRDPALVERLKTGLFDIRQAPISARKAHTAFSLETAMQMIDNLRRGVSLGNPEDAAKSVHEAMLNMSRTLAPEGAAGPEYKYWAEQGAEDLKAWAYGRSEKARLASAAFTARGARAEKMLPQIAREGLDSVIGPVHGGRMAEENTSRIGRVSEYLSEAGRDMAGAATGKVGKIFAKHGPALAMGLGAIAALGIALTPRRTPVATFGRPSGNRYRPEEKMGVADSIPGEPVAGQMAPSAPPRRMGEVSRGVKKAVVAPFDSTSDLTVTMRAEDSSRAADTARKLSMIPGSGDTNVTINYRDHTKLRSLRTRERIRDMR